MNQHLWTVVVAPPGEEPARMKWYSLAQCETYLISLANRHGDAYVQHCTIHPPLKLAGVTPS